MKRYIQAGVAALLLVASAAGAQTKVTFGYIPVSEYAAAYAAKDLGIFAKHGLDVDFLVVPGASLAPGLQSGSLQIAALPPTNFLLAVDGGIDLVALAGAATMSKTDTSSSMLVKTGSSIKTAGDLVGKKIAVTSVGGVMDVMTRKWLQDSNVDVKKVNFVEVNLPQMGDVLKGGSVDAVTAVDPFKSRIEQSGVGTPLVALASVVPEGSTAIFYAANRDWVNSNPKAASAFREAIAEGIDAISRDPEQARASIAKYTKLPPAVVAGLPLPHLSATVTADQIAFWSQLMRAQGLLKGSPDASSLIAK